MNESDRAGRSARLERECRSFAWALVSDVPTDDVIAAYERAHDHMPLAVGGSRIDRLLVATASMHSWLARLADAYAALFVRKGRFRTKLVVLLAMLESSAPHHWRFERESVSPPAAWSRLVFSGVAAVVTLVLGTVLFGLPHLVTGLLEPRRPASSGSEP